MDFPGTVAHVKSAGAAATFKNCEFSSIVQNRAVIFVGDDLSQGNAGVQLQNTTLTSSSYSFRMEAYNASEVYTDFPVYLFRWFSNLTTEQWNSPKAGTVNGLYEPPLGLADAANSSLQFISLSDAQSLFSVRPLISATLRIASLPFTYLCCHSAQPSVRCIALHCTTDRLT
jgi:hypothetical protein